MGPAGALPAAPAMQRHGHHDAGSPAVAAEGIKKGTPGIVISAVIMTRPTRA